MSADINILKELIWKINTKIKKQTKKITKIRRVQRSYLNDPNHHHKYFHIFLCLNNIPV